MPTFTTIAWETLLEPRVRDSYKSSFDSKQRSGGFDDGDDKEVKKKVRAPNHIYISPALYATPEPTPIPDSSSDPVSPSPYVVNHKRRGGGRSGRHPAVSQRIDGFEVEMERKFRDGERNSDISDVVLGVRVQEEVINEKVSGVETAEERDESSVVGDGFLSPLCESTSVTTASEMDDLGKQGDSATVMSSQAEFYDADEDFSDGAISIASPSHGLSIESELSATKLSLLEEIERRKTAEDSLRQMCSQWQRIANRLSREGLTFPMPSNSPNVQLEFDSVEQFSQELLVARFVSEAIGKGQARAEAEIAAEAILESKDQEISRLRDRLQYYEAVNHDMSQRNQEVMEVARSQRQKRRHQRKWLWGCVGVSFAVGASLLAYSYLPQTSEYQELNTTITDCSEATSRIEDLQ